MAEKNTKKEQQKYSSPIHEDYLSDKSSVLNKLVNVNFKNGEIRIAMTYK